MAQTWISLASGEFHRLTCSAENATDRLRGVVGKFIDLPGLPGVVRVDQVVRVWEED